MTNGTMPTSRPTQLRLNRRLIRYEPIAIRLSRMPHPATCGKAFGSLNHPFSNSSWPAASSVAGGSAVGGWVVGGRVVAPAVAGSEV
jgi:hypothetical protein